jgi:hypothetical protein
MIVNPITTLIDKGDFSKSQYFKRVLNDIYRSIDLIEWPPGAGKFLLYAQSGKKRNEGNGVVPIKKAFTQNLARLGWVLEAKIDIATVKRPGPIDATFKIKNKLFAVEWETGNISSSHRALNKMALGIQKEILIGGILILPTRVMYNYLTDRIGNYSEIEPYFPLWASLPCKEGYLGVLAIEHDGISHDIQKIPKGTDGRALQ